MPVQRNGKDEPQRNGLRLIQVFFADNKNPGTPHCDRDECLGQSVAMFVKLADPDNRAYCLCYEHCVEEWGERPPVATRENPNVQMYFGRS
jgi:hypothetical protein